MRTLKSILIASLTACGLAPLTGCVVRERVYDRPVVYREHYSDHHAYYARDYCPPPRAYHDHWRR